MKYVGVDLHKKTISICVVRLEGRQRVVVLRKRLFCSNTEGIYRFFQELGPFEVVVEATASYEWFIQLIEKLAQRTVLAHPKKLRVIAESAYKTDRIDATVLAELLALDMVPESYRPTPRQREHRVLTRHRYYLQKRSTSVRNKIRRILSNYNADCPELFSRSGLAQLAQLNILPADRFVLDQLVEEWRQHEKRLKEADRQLAAFGRKAPAREEEGRQILDSIPSVGSVTIDVVLAEVGPADRIRSMKRAGSFIGLAPGVRQSDGKVKEQGITKGGSRLLRWALIQAAWRLVRTQAYWRSAFERIARRRGRKRAITAIARRVFCMMISMLRSGQRYRVPGGDPASREDFRRHGKGVRGAKEKRPPAAAKRSRARAPSAHP